MVFSRGWDNTTPPGTRNANEIDDIIREFKVDLSERFLSKLLSALPNTTVESDVIVKPEILGNGTKKMVIHGTAFTMESSDNGSYLDSGESGLGTYGGFRAALQLPNGVSITQIRWLVTNNNAVTLTLDLRSLAFAVGLATAVLDHRTTIVVGTQIVDSGVLGAPIAIDSGTAYHLFFDSNGALATSFILHAVEITYTTPDCRNTI